MAVGDQGITFILLNEKLDILSYCERQINWLTASQGHSGLPTCEGQRRAKQVTLGCNRGFLGSSLPAGSSLQREAAFLGGLSLPGEQPSRGSTLLGEQALDGAAVPEGAALLGSSLPGGNSWLREVEGTSGVGCALRLLGIEG